MYHDELLTKKELCDRVLHMDVKTAERHILYKKGFPYFPLGENNRRYSLKAVEEWLRKNQKKITY